MNAESRRIGWHGVAVVLAAMLAYGCSLFGTFVYDDFHSVAHNPHLREVGNPLRFFAQPEAFSGLGMRMYRPVLVLSFALNYQLGTGAIAFKAVNLVLHALVAWLLWRWLRAWAVPQRAATIAASLFAVHPLASEAVNLVSGRSELLLAVGTLLALLVHRRALDCGTPWWRHVVLALATIVACGCKETGAVLPVLLLVQELLARATAAEPLLAPRWWGRIAVRTGVVAVVVCGYLLLRRHYMGVATVALEGRTGDDPLVGAGRDLVTQLATMGTLLPRVLLQTVIPFGLSLEPPVDYRHTFLDPIVLAGWGALALLVGVGLWRWRAHPVRAFGVVLAGGMAAPWVLIPLNVPLSEHRLYCPLLGLACVFATLSSRAAWTLPVPPRTFLLHAAAPVATLLVMAGLAAERSLLYRDERLLWRAALALDPQSFRAQWGLGLTMQRQGDRHGGLRHLRRARLLYPGNRNLWRSELEALLELPVERRREFQALVLGEELHAMAPSDAWFRILLARAQIQAGEAQPAGGWLARAEATALSCLQVAPPKGLVYMTAAAARRAAGDLQGALAHLDSSVQRGLDHWTVLLDRAAVHETLGRRVDAERDVLRAQQQAPFEPAVQRACQRLLAVAPGR